jgi:hypothetical protein
MLPLHAGGDLDPRHVDAVDAHLKDCLPCFREFREYASMRSRLGVLAEERLPDGALEGFAEEVMARIAVGEPGPAAVIPGTLIKRWPSLPQLAAAASLLIVCLAGWRYMSDGALQALERPASVSSLPPSNTVSQSPQSRWRGALPTTGFRSALNGSPMTMGMPPGMQGLRPLSQEELSLIHQASVAGAALFIQCRQGGELEESAELSALPVEPLR